MPTFEEDNNDDSFGVGYDKWEWGNTQHNKHDRNSTKKL